MTNKDCKDLLALWGNSTFWAGKPAIWSWAEGRHGDYTVSLTSLDKVDSFQAGFALFTQFDPLEPGIRDSNVYITALGVNGTEYWSDALPKYICKALSYNRKIAAIEKKDNKLVSLIGWRDNWGKEHEEIIECVPKDLSPTKQKFDPEDWAEIPRPYPIKTE